MDKWCARSDSQALSAVPALDSRENIGNPAHPYLLGQAMVSETLECLGAPLARLSPFS
jgi:hypothetical protein